MSTSQNTDKSKVEAQEMTRIDARIPVYVRDIIDRAVALRGGTRTDFLISAAMEKAEQVLTNHAIIKLSPKDQEVIANALLEEKIEPVSDFALSIMREYYQKGSNE